MPTHRQLIHAGPDTNQVAIGVQSLIVAGPRLAIDLSVPDPLQQLLISRGEPVPAPVVGEALVDTGASHTCIDIAAAVALNLPVVDQQINRTAGGEVTVNRHPVRLTFATQALHPIPLLIAAGCELANQGLVALIGRDFLAGKLLIYDGYLAQFTISW